MKRKHPLNNVVWDIDGYASIEIVMTALNNKMRRQSFEVSYHLSTTVPFAQMKGRECFRILLTRVHEHFYVESVNMGIGVGGLSPSLTDSL